MAGVGIIVGGWFASAAIGKFVNAAGSYLSGNYRLHKEAKEMLTKLKITLPEMQAIMEEAEKQQIQNQGVIEWMRIFKDAANEAEDMLDDFAAKSISEDLKGKNKVSKTVASFSKGVKNTLLPDNDINQLKAVFRKLEGLCQHSKIFLRLLELNSDHNMKNPASAKSGEPIQILPLDDQLIGRDSEIEYILSLILGYKIDLPEHGTSSGDNDGDAGPSNTSYMSKEVGKIELGTSSQKQEMRVGTSSQKQEMRVGTLLTNIETSHFGRPHIIPIVGICGLGKTFLAHFIYKHQLLEGRFHLKKWFYMSQASAIDKMLKTLIPSLDFSDPVDLGKQLESIIEGKRFFFVLDDVRSEVCSHLVDLLSRFNIGAYGSVILVTTREKNVPKLLGINYPIILNPLEWHYFLPLLEYYAFRNVNIQREKRSDMEQICSTVGRKLHGIPQATKMIGNMLRLKFEDKMHWESILNNPNFCHENFFSFIDVAYQQLDRNLKKCLAFCSTFPTNHIVERNRVIQLWIANNFIQLNSHNEVKSEYIGEIWFNELVNFSFFLPTPWPNWYTMSSAMRELAVGLSANEAFIFDDNPMPNSCLHGCSLQKDDPNPCTHGYSVIDNHPRKIPPSTRYLTIRTTEATINLGSCSNNMRTLLFQSDYYESSVDEQKKGLFVQFSKIMKKNNHKQSISGSFLRTTGKLRVLEISCADDWIVKQIDVICQLPHHRFLDLSYSGIIELPETICTLYHLQVLDIRGSKFEILPLNERIMKLPKKMNNLINLRHFKSSKETISLISGIGRLTNLQDLEEFRVTNEIGHMISELAEMNEIGGQLSIVGLENVKDESEARGARLAEKRYLKVVSLEWTKKHLESTTNMDNMEKANKIFNSLQPHSAIEELEIENFQGTKLPSWTTLGLPNIRRIYLKSCHQIKNLPPFGRLPFLETLVLEDLTLECIGEELYGLGTPIFPKLKVLRFVRMEKWKVWSPAGESELLPRLEELEIQNCRVLKQTPLLSLKLSCLKKLELSRCERVVEEGSLFDKHLLLLNSLCISDNPRIILACQNVPNLKLLSLHWTDARFIGDGPSLLNLKSLILDNCYVPWNRGMIFRSLTNLEMNGYLNDILEMSHSSFPSLKVLKLNCSLLEHPDNCLIREKHLLQETKEYRAQMCQRTNDIERHIRYFNDKIKNSIIRSLQYLNRCTHSNKGLSNWIMKLPHLLELNLDIGSLTEFPSTLATLVSLKSLTLTRRGVDLGQGMDYLQGAIERKMKHYLEIQSLPESRMPPNLKELYITDASDQLQQRCSKEEGEDWPKIAHIPYIRVNNETLQML